MKVRLPRENPRGRCGGGRTTHDTLFMQSSFRSFLFRVFGLFRLFFKTPWMSRTPLRVRLPREDPGERFGGGTTRAEDALGPPTQSHISSSILEFEDTPPRILVYEDKDTLGGPCRAVRRRAPHSIRGVCRAYSGCYHSGCLAYSGCFFLQSVWLIQGVS